MSKTLSNETRDIEKSIEEPLFATSGAQADMDDAAWQRKGASTKYKGELALYVICLFLIMCNILGNWIFVY